VLLRFLLTIILATKVYKAAILKGLTNRKLNLISIGFCQQAYKKRTLGNLHYYSSHFFTSGLKY
jgi:hypothetical protein